MESLRRLALAPQALKELGPKPLAHYAVYRLGLWSGYLRWKTPPGGSTRPARPPSPGPGRPSPFDLQPLLPLPDRTRLTAVLADRLEDLLAEAQAVCNGQVRLFGGPAVPLELTPPAPLSHWTTHAQSQAGGDAQDPKLIWEHGRFGWAYTLARAYHASGEAQFAEAFWTLCESFLEANPPNLGPHWASAQEVALRLMALVFAYQVLSHAAASTPARRLRLGQAVGDHAARIPPTLAYARAQNNNHLLVEAAGLYTAGLALPAHPAAKRWRRLGWQLANHALQAQIDPDGTYIQHSANYHRLMLQAALWVAALARAQSQTLPLEARERLAAATEWALALLDPPSGAMPNLGPNDGAYIQPLAACPFGDHRPVVAAAALAFRGERRLPPGPWDEATLWLGLDPGQGHTAQPQLAPTDRLPVVHNPGNASWAYLRAARFRSRPGHADQLHVDLWWRGHNLALDAGTYRYAAPPPWDNALAGTDVHNTVMIDGQDQMRPAGRFLWLGWAQAEVISREQDARGQLNRLVARHDGYRRLGVIHQRSITVHADGHWSIMDELLPAGAGSPRAEHDARLHWLVPDWPWTLEQQGNAWVLRLRSPAGEITLHIGLHGESPPAQPARFCMARAGELLQGEGPVRPTWGWYSPTYGCKRPALSVAVTTRGRLPLGFASQWILSKTRRARAKA